MSQLIFSKVATWSYNDVCSPEQSQINCSDLAGLEHKWVLVVPKHLLYWLQQISIHEVNVRMLVDIFIKDYQIANVMDADASSNHNRNVSTYPKSHCVWIHALSIFLQHLPRPSSVWTMNLHSSESTTKDHLPLGFQCWIILAHLMSFCLFWYEPWYVVLSLWWICHLRRLTAFLWQKRAIKSDPVKGQLWGCLQISQPWQHLPTSACESWRLLRTNMPAFILLLPDSLNLAQICCTFFYCSWTALQLHDFKSHYFTIT